MLEANPWVDGTANIAIPSCASAIIDHRKIAGTMYAAGISIEEILGARHFEAETVFINKSRIYSADFGTARISRMVINNSQFSALRLSGAAIGSLNVLGVNGINGTEQPSIELCNSKVGTADFVNVQAARMDLGGLHTTRLIGKVYFENCEIGVLDARHCRISTFVAHNLRIRKAYVSEANSLTPSSLLDALKKSAQEIEYVQRP